MQNLITKLFFNPIFRRVYYTLVVPFRSLSSSGEYWKKRYKTGGTSGPGSYNQLASFKAEVLNDFVREHDVKKVIEFGCGDGNQLKLAKYPAYIGFDISAEAIEQCKTTFSGDSSKEFKLVEDFTNESASLTLSLDVIYHLLENGVFYTYMSSLFKASVKYVIIYSSNINQRSSFHVRHRKFSKWVEKNKPDWKLIQQIPNKYPYLGDNENEKSFADFYIYEKK